MTEQEMHAALEARGYVRDFNGGGTYVYRRGPVIVSGADGDLPAWHWFGIGVYADWDNSADSVLWERSDFSAEWPDMGPALDFWAELAAAEAFAAQRMGKRFADILRDWFTPEQWTEMRARNARAPYAGPDGPCASHDFCDANEAMAKAFREIMGRDILPDDGSGMTDADCLLWNQAWTIAKAEFLTA